MLVIEDNSVYEIDEECVKRKKVPEECQVYQKLLKERGREEAAGREQGKRMPRSPEGCRFAFFVEETE